MSLLGGLTGNKFSGLPESYFAQPVHPAFRGTGRFGARLLSFDCGMVAVESCHSSAIPSIALISNVFSAKTDLPSKDEQRLLELVNQERETAGLKPLTWDKDLAEAARAHSRLLAQHRSLSHQFMGEPDLTKRAGAAGAAFSQWRKRWLRPGRGRGAQWFHELAAPSGEYPRPDFNAVGIAIVPRGDELYITQDFSRNIETVSNDQFDRQLIAAFNQLRSQRTSAHDRTD